MVGGGYPPEPERVLWSGRDDDYVNGRAGNFEMLRANQTLVSTEQQNGRQQVPSDQNAAWGFRLAFARDRVVFWEETKVIA